MTRNDPAGGMSLEIETSRKCYKILIKVDMKTPIIVLTEQRGMVYGHHKWVRSLPNPPFLLRILGFYCEY